MYTPSTHLVHTRTHLQAGIDVTCITHVHQALPTPHRLAVVRGPLLGGQIGQIAPASRDGACQVVGIGRGSMADLSWVTLGHYCSLAVRRALVVDDDLLMVTAEEQ